MPIYEYECTKCGVTQEVWQKMTDKPIKKCESCSGKLQKLISQSTFHLKGSGWYATDYAGKSTGNSAASSEESPKKPKVEKKTDSSVKKESSK